jgi:DNA-binding SARP family transcriptional activator
VELGVLGPLQVRKDGVPVVIPGAKPRAILTMLGLHSGSIVSADTLIELLWGDDPPRTAAKALPTHISALRRALGDGFVLTEGAGWTLAESEVDASRYKSAARLARDAAAAGDTSQAVSRFAEALALWRGIPELPDGRRGTSEKTRWIEGHAALVEDRADALLATGRAAEIIGELEAAVAEAPLRERRWGQLMLALYRAGRQGDALGAYQRARALLADELGIDPGPELRRLEAAIVAQDAALEIPAAQDLPTVTRTVTFLLTDIEGSTAAWEVDADAMAAALARHDELVEQIVTSRGGRLIKTRGEGDATFSVFERASAAAAAAIELQDAIFHEPWALPAPMRIRVALHTGEVELRDGDYFGRAVNRAARLRSLATGGQILCSGAIAELVIDSLPDDVVLADLGMRQLKNLARPEHVFELRLETASDVPQPQAGDEPLERPGLPAVLTGPGPFVGRGRELERLVSAWQTAVAGGTHAVLIAGEPGVGKTRLAGEWSQQAYQLEAIVLYGRCDEDLGAPYQPFAEALRSLMPCLGTSRLRGVRGVEALLPLVPGLTELLPDLAAPTRADPETERYALFDAVVALLEVASTSAPVVLVLDDLHWAAKPTLLLLRHLLRFGDRARVQIVGTYRSTDLDRSHPLAAMLADLHRGAGSGTANRLTLSGLDEADVTTYVTEAGYHDEELARALASVTGGNPFFLIEALRHVDETGGVWDPTTLPQGVRETVSRRLSRLPAETNTALAAAAVVGSRFALDLVEKVVEQDLVDPFDEACKAGIVIEEPGGRYRFNHAIVRQSLLAELPSVRRMRLHQRIATTLENEAGADDELLAELAHHYFECAWAGNAAKAVEYCRRAGDQAVARLGYEGAADLYGQALHALDEIDDELPDRDDQAAELLVARCEALLAAGDVASAAGAVSKLQEATVNSARLAAWATCFDGQLSMLIHPERLDEVETALGMAAQKLAELDDAAGEANAHTVRAACLARLGRIGDGEIALDDALTAARRARDHRRVNAVLAGAPLAALWGPNPVPRAGGRCLDVVRLLRITTDSPAVEATSTRCQAVLEAFRGRAEAARRMIDSARRTVTELGLRHALLEVEQFAGVVELIADDPTAAEPHFRQAYNGFRRMGLDADTAETAALLGCTCLALDQHAEADELCLESERLAGHALKASIAWRTLRARLLSRGGEHGEARRIAEAAVALAERTDALVDHGDACASLATVLGAAGDAAGARTAAERAVDLYERKGAAALAEKARRILGERDRPSAPAPPEPPPVVELDNACTRAGKRLVAAVNRGALDEYEQLHAPNVFSESRRKALGFTHAAVAIVPPENWAHEVRRVLGTTGVRLTGQDIAVRGERLALARVTVGTADVSPGAPHDEFLQVYGVDEEGRISLQIWFDVEDMDAAVAELDAAHARFEEEAHRHARRLENAASVAADRYLAHFAARDWDELAKVLADDISVDDRRRVVNAGTKHGRDAEVANLRAAADVGITYFTSVVIAARGQRLILGRASGSKGEFFNEVLGLIEINSQNEIAAIVVFDVDDFDTAIAELDARYLAGEAAAHANTWSVISGGHGALNRREFPPLAPDCVSIDHRRGAAFAPGELTAYFRAGFDLNQDIQTYVEVVHRLSDLGAVCTHAAHGVSHEGFDAEWRGIDLLTIDGDMVNRCEVFDEADIDAALARFDQLSRPARRLENAASHAAERYMAYFADRDWGELAKILADDICTEDRRHIVGAGIKHGRDAEIANLRAAADVGILYFTSVVIAARGERLVLAHLSGGQGGSEEFLNEVLGVAEINSDNQISAIVVFELDDFDSALAELDARYLAGEAAAYAQVVQPVMDTVGELDRHEPGPMLARLSFADHRRVPFGSAENYGRAIEELWTLVPDARNWMRAVHALDAHGLVSTLVIEGTDAHGNELEWVRTFLYLSDGPRVDVYDEADLDVALARFEELRPQARRLDNAASQAAERHLAHFAARDWDALAKVLADDICIDDRRRPVNAGIKHGRDAEIANLRAVAEAGVTYTAFVVIAARGERLILARASVSSGGSAEFATDALSVVEINSHNQIAAIVIFELDDFDAAIAELDARYLAGEAAAHAQIWSVVAGSYAAQARHELPAMTPDCVTIDHRRAKAFAPGEMTAYIRAGWDLEQTIRTHVEVVHRLNDLGAVCTYAGHGNSHEGFDAEWREIAVTTVEGDMVSRCELFDEADLDAAIARFDQLGRPALRLENAASRVAERALSYFATRDWEAVGQVLADDFVTDDRRRAVNAGIRHGRDAEIENWQAAVDVGFTNLTPTVVATRGGRLVLAHLEASGSDPAAIRGEFLVVTEIDADERIVAFVVFEFDDLEAASAELDARYVAGEAAAHSHTWSVVTQACAALNRREQPPTTPDWVNIDHRRGTPYASGEMSALLDAAWKFTTDLSHSIAAVHRLSDLGAVVTNASHETSQEGFAAEWRVITVATVQGDMLNRCEVFDEADLGAALAMFDELSRPALRLENTASQVAERFSAHFAARDWSGVAGILADDISTDDRRRVVGAGLRRGRDAVNAELSAVTEIGVESATSDTIATRGARLVLSRARTWGHDRRPEAFLTDMLSIVEINADDRIVALVTFDADDTDAAFEELDARYLAGEAAPHAGTWSVITSTYAAINRHEVAPTTADWVFVDHLPLQRLEAGDVAATIRATWDLTPDIHFYIEAVHGLSNLGGVVTRAASGTSHEGFDAEWRQVDLLTVEGDVVNRCEVFDEADLDDALARFDELSRPALRLENTATRVFERLYSYFAAGDWDAVAKITANNVSVDDRRRVVNAGIRHGRDANIKDAQATVDVGFTMTVVGTTATRGERLALMRVRVSGSDSETIQNDALNIVELDADERIAADVVFDLDDLDAAIAELDSRYIAGEAAAHAGTWSVIARAYNGFNQGGIPATTQDWVNVDHRKVIAFAPGDMAPYIRATWAVAPDVKICIEVVHRLSNLGAVFTHVGSGMSREGSAAEWREITLMTREGDLINRCELFDEADLDAALARFDHLSRPAPRLENTATRAYERLLSYVAAADWHAVAQTAAENISIDDRRRVVNAPTIHGRDAAIENAQATADVGFTMTMLGTLATRGERLVLMRVRASGRDPEAIQNDVLQIVELDAAERIVGFVVFDLDDFDAAIAELDTRYIAGQGAAHAGTWSLIAGAFVALNRRELPATTPDVVSIDHRRLAAFAPGEIIEFVRTAFDQIPDLSFRIEAVHRLSNLGAVVTQALRGTSREGFEAEWREINVLMVEGDLFNRSEIFDEADLDAALAKFGQLSRPAPRLENTATRVQERVFSYIAARDWDAVAQITVENVSVDDRRRVVNAGIRHGRNAAIEEMQATVDVGFTITMVGALATRGAYLALLRVRVSGRDAETIQNDALTIVEIDADERVAGNVVFDLDDFDAAFAELDARYLAGEGATHAGTWSLIAGAFAALNRRELPATTTDPVSMDHRRVAAFAPGEGFEYIRAGWDLDQNLKLYIETAHRVNDLGAVFTFMRYGTSHEGFEAEWRGVNLMTVDGEMLDRSEVFDEADLDAALARFDQLSQPAPQLENAASRLTERFLACFAAGDWDAIAEIMAEDFSHDDRRPVVGSGVQRGRDAYIVDMRAVADLWNSNLKSTVVAIRGERLLLMRNRLSVRDEEPEAFSTEVLAIGEIDADERAVAVVTFDVDDVDAAFEELDARYLAGEAAPHAHAWSVIARTYAGVNRQDLPATPQDFVDVDHRHVTNLAPGDGIANLRAAWEQMLEPSVHIEAVHRLTDLGAVFSFATKGTSKEGFEAEWRTVNLMTVEDDLINRSELFDEADLNAAIARFEELHPQTPQLENVASRVDKRFQACFAARDWDAMAEMLSDGFSVDDRRRVVNAGSLQGRDAELIVHAYAALGSQNVTSTLVATRAQRLALSRFRFSDHDPQPDAFRIEMLVVVEIDADERMAAVVVFDIDDIDAAFEELDARYLAGEAAPHAHAWSVIARTFAGVNRQELPATPQDFVDIDHRHVTKLAPGDGIANLRAAWEQMPELSVHIEAVHRLTDLGAVFSFATKGTSKQGFDAEWRTVNFMTVENDLINRSELFDEADLDVALARFEELHPQTPQLENAASRLNERFFTLFAAGDWDAIAEMTAEDFSHDDRRPVVGAGVQHGRDAYIVDMRAVAELWNTNVKWTVVAIRGERLVLTRNRLSSRDQGPELFFTEVLAIGEIDADGRAVAVVTFDVDDIDAAFKELDARYLTGEAATHAHTWSVIAGIYAGFNRREPPATTPDSVFIDHRPLQNLGDVDLVTAIRSMWDVASDFNVCIEAVRRLSELGAVVTQTLKGTSQEGLDAEWRTIEIFTVEGDLLSRCEAFDETDLDAALARFEELQPQPRRLENAASRLHERFLEYYAARDSQAMAEMLVDHYSSDDRRRVVGSGVRHGRDAHIADMRARAGLWNTNLESTIMAIRGERLALMRIGLSDRDKEPEAFSTEVLAIGEINADEWLVATVTFDLDEIDAAFAELDARYLAGEAAADARTWSAIAGVYAAFNRRELPAPDYVTVDHRRATLFTSDELATSIRDSLDLTPDLSIHIEAVHRLNNFGALLTNASYGTSQEGFGAEWRMIQLLTVEGDRVNRLELFDETDLDAALARLEELQAQAPRPENAATRVYERLQAYFAAREWDAMAEILTDDHCSDDRRRAVNAGIRRGRDMQIANMQTAVGLGTTNITSTVVATRGERLALRRVRFSGRDQRLAAFHTETLGIAEIDADERIAALVTFDADDIDAAFAELDARYLVGEAAPHAHTWSVIARECAAFNRHELTAVDYITVDHRQLPIVEAYSQAALRVWEVTPDFNIHIEAVHRLSRFGVVATYKAYGTSPEGFEAEWRMVELLTFEGDLINCCEVFDESDLDAALARFEELQPPAPRLENAASRVDEQLRTHLTAPDWDAMANLLTEDTCTDDRRRIVNVGIRRGRDVTIAYGQAMADLGLKIVMSDVVAIRGERLFLSRARWLGPNQQSEDFHTEVLNVVEIDSEQRIAARVMFDADDIDAAFEELDARYLAGEAAPHAHTWSVIAREFAAFNRRELTAVDYIIVDHRQLPIVEVYSQAALRVWEVTPDFNIHIEAVHRLNRFGVVATYKAYGTSPEGFEAEWRGINVLTVEGDRINCCEVYDESDLDAALARFEELQPQAPRLENPASQIVERYLACISAGDWAAMAEVLADDIVADDRRHVVNAGVRRGRDVHITDMQATVDVSAPTFSSSIIATRGERLALAHVRIFNRGMIGEVGAEALGIGEIDADERLVAAISFDLDDFDAAIAELDARYLVGEAAPHAHAWSVITGGYAAFNRREVPQTTQDLVSIDHRRAIAFAPGELNPYMQATWDMAPDVYTYADAAHRLSDLGAVATQVSRGTSQQGFDGEWREIVVITVEGDLINRIEIFEEADLDAALARFEELQPHARRLENAASQLYERFKTCFASRDWVGVAAMLADDIFTDDRRRVVNTGIQQGRDASMADLRALADVGVESMTSIVVATRGERLVLACVCSRMHDDVGLEDIVAEVLSLVEIDCDNRIAAGVTFDLDDFDAAFEELEARYLAGEGAAHAQTWSVIARTYAAFNRHEFPSTTQNSVYIDHRPLVTNDATALTANIRASWDLMDVSTYIAESVHRLSKLGAVVTQSLKGSSKEGLDIESRMIDVFTVEGDLVSRVEVFDEADLDAALARFDELQPPPRRLENAASQVYERFKACFASRDWVGIAAITTDDISTDDRRRVVNAGAQHGRDVQMADLRAMAGVGVERVTSIVVATRGERLALVHVCAFNRDMPAEIGAEMLSLVEIDCDNRIAAGVVFDLHDVEAAFHDLDARYLAGEAAAYSDTWSIVTQAYAELNRQEIPPITPDCVVIDHRRAIAFASDVVPYLHATWDVTPDVKMYIEAVHGLTNRGAVVTWATYGTSQEGFDAEWRGINILTVEGDLIDGGEIFDEADLETALVRFEELQPQAPRLENAAGRIVERYFACFSARDWAAMAELLTDDIVVDDRRRVVNAGIRRGRDVHIADTQAGAEVGAENQSSSVIATRGERLALAHVRTFNHGFAADELGAEMLGIVEIDADAQIVAIVVIDLDDTDAAFAELDARYLAGEAAAYAQFWSAIAEVYARLNRHELPPTMSDWVTIDHRVRATFEGEDLNAYTRTAWEQTPDIRVYIEAVHRLSNLGAVCTHIAHGRSEQGFEAEWRMIELLTFGGDAINRCELFDEADLDAVLATFDELERRTPSFGNAATRTWARAAEAFNGRDVDSFLALMTANGQFEDRRKGLRAMHEGPERRKAARAVFEEAPASWRMRAAPIAIRGSRLELTRECYCDTDDADRPIAVELLHVMELDDADLMRDIVSFDPDDLDDAFAELTARWIASGEVAYPELIEAVDRINAAINRHDWDAVATYFDGAEYVNHRQPAQAVNGTIADWLSSMQTTGSLVPNFWVELAEVLARSAIGIVGRMALKGTSTDGAAIEIPFVVLILLRGERVTRLEAFEEDQRDLALARLQELNRPV